MEIQEVKLHLYTSPHNCSFLKPKQRTKLNKLFFQKSLHKYIKQFDHLSHNKQVWQPSLASTNLSNGNEVQHASSYCMQPNNQWRGLHFVMKNSRGFNRKLELTQEFSSLISFSASIDNTTILRFNHRQREKNCFLEDQTKGP